jgi:DNA-binding NarL/FixJ family response regulator
MFNEGLTEALNHSDTVRVSRTFTTLDACQMAFTENRPDVLLLDISIPNGDAIAFCQQMINDYPKMKIVAVTIHDEYSIIQRMLDCGVHGYVLKSSPVYMLIDAITCVWQGDRFISPEVEDIIRQGSIKVISLTNVERNVLRLLCDGKTNPEIAEHLSLGVETVKWYRKRLLSKYGVRNTVALVRLALKEQLLG